MGMDGASCWGLKNDAGLFFTNLTKPILTMRHAVKAIFRQRVHPPIKDNDSQKHDTCKGFPLLSDNL